MLPNIECKKESAKADGNALVAIFYTPNSFTSCSPALAKCTDKGRGLQAAPFCPWPPLLADTIIPISRSLLATPCRRRSPLAALRSTTFSPRACCSSSFPGGSCYDCDCGFGFCSCSASD
eukprot:gnl/TRDRNA2_/TRDRNA2_164085_c2_seq1.p4 gnl/TRDRNA2_/TRDRNA2_164085_c2~~gnl/TRDRNA2_/TRDRNA2_164085_c2_seq1.p4  ORF type:complete len:120 (+),score=14.98 gnl/TRDRNA2_/TRDRNA2_164085_c2_seq1:349-708(+)